jgi:hypothetical protein
MEDDMSVFVIEDELHDEQQGEYGSMAEALAELERLAKLPWDKPPNIAPCTSWRTCGRFYQIIEYDNSVTPWKELDRDIYLEVSAAGVKWIRDPG